MFARLVWAYPDKEVLLAQYNSVVATIESEQRLTKAALQAAKLVTLPAPPATQTLRRDAMVESDAIVPKLAKVERTKNAITDEEQWFVRNELRLPVFFVPPAGDFLFAPGTLSSTTVASSLSGFVYTEYEPSRRFLEEPPPPELPTSYGTMPLSRAIASAPYVLGIYAERVVAVFEGDALVALFDFEAYAHPPASRTENVKIGDARVTTRSGTVTGEIVVAAASITLDLRFALAREGVLYVEHANLSSAKDNLKQNAYITAVDLASGELLWRSAPLVANAFDFAIVDGGILSGYGFTREPDFLFVLDRKTGAIRQKVALESGPEYIVARAGRVYLRAYSSDYVFAAAGR